MFKEFKSYERKTKTKRSNRKERCSKQIKKKEEKEEEKEEEEHKKTLSKIECKNLINSDDNMDELFVKKYIMIMLYVVK